MRKALIVGIDKYPNNPLSGCENDATNISSLLQKHQDKSPNFAVETLKSSELTIDRATLRRKIEQLFDGNNDISLLYFSGHGYVKSTGGYLVTVDAKKYDEGISMDEILNLANNSRAKDKIIILDCCFSGNFGSPVVINNGSSMIAEGVSILTASRSDEAAIESGGSGLFTSLVLDALGGGAADLRGEITPGSVYAYVDQALGPWDQRPLFKTNIARFTSIRKVSPPVALEVLRKIIEYFDTPESLYRLTPAYEFTELVKEDSKVEIFKNLQKYASVGLVVPVGEEHMYFAAINSKACRLTAYGRHYWRLVKENRI